MNRRTVDLLLEEDNTIGLESSIYLFICANVKDTVHCEMEQFFIIRYRTCGSTGNQASCAGCCMTQ